MFGETVGQMIRRVRKARGWSQAELAERTCKTAGLVEPYPLGRQEIHRYEKDERSPRGWMVHLAVTLGIPVTEFERVVIATRTGAVSPSSVSDFLPKGDPLAPLITRSDRRIGMGEVKELHARIHSLRLADDVVYGHDLISRALRELRSAVETYRQCSYSGEVGRELLRNIGELAQLTGWIAYDAGRYDEATKIFELGLSAAHEAGDSTLASNLLGTLAYQVSNAGDPREAVKMATAALVEGKEAPPRARALSFDRVAWANAQAGNGREAIKALELADDALSEHAGEEDPAYLYWVDSSELQIMKSRVYTELRRPLRAVPLLEDVLKKYTPTHTRELALYSSWLAIALADANEPEQAAVTAAQVLTLSAETASERTTDRSRIVLARLKGFSDVPEVAELFKEFPQYAH